MANIVGTLLIVILALVAIVYIIHMIPGLPEALGCLKGDKSPLCLVLDTAGAVTGARWLAKNLGITRKASKIAKEIEEGGKIVEEIKGASFARKILNIAERA